jgi:hypothetical protein
MDTTSIPGTTRGGETRAMRGLQLFRRRGAEITVYLDGTYGVPSKSEESLVYCVDLEAETCECPDHEYKRVTCCHQYAALIYRAKHRNRSPFGGAAPAGGGRRCGRTAA